jgi:UDP-N-acetyl-alpha-D-quinovosamine dehydrogenase
VLKVLVTGANGFIGKALCERLLAEKWNVQGTVRSSDSLASLLDGVSRLTISSIDDKTDWSNALLGVDSIIHLAACVHTKNNATAIPQSFRLVNTIGTERLAIEAAIAGVRRFIYMSSVKVNGEGSPKPYNEEDIQQPQDAYSMSKSEAEKILNKIAEKSDMEIVILRSPLVYGPRVKANFLSLLKVVDQGIPLPLASIKNRRSFIYLENLIDAIVTCITDPKAAGNTYFVSDGEDVSTPELIRRISSALGKPARLFPFPPFVLKMAGIVMRKSEAIDRILRSLTVDCSKIRRELSWQAPFSMDQGLIKTAKWYKKGGLNSGVRYLIL